MKRLLIPILFVTGVMGYLSCQKDKSNGAASSVQAAKTEGIKKGETVTFSVQNLSGQTAKWSVSPSTNAQLTSNGDKATVLFRLAGSYSVLATMGNTTARVLVNVTDSSYCDSTRRDTCCGCPKDTIPTDTCRNGACLRDTTLSLAGDQIYINPVKIDSGGLSGLRIRSVTQNMYPCANNTLKTSVSNVGTSYSFFYAGVYISGACVPGQKTGYSEKVLYPIADGVHSFSVIVNNIIYSGSFTKTGSQYSFTWPHTSGVTISPLNL